MEQNWWQLGHVPTILAIYFTIANTCCIFFQFEQLAKTCRTCQREFSVLTLQHNCVVCGVSVCDKCSSMDLIVYVPCDEVKESGDKYIKPKLAVIKVVGVRK